MGQCIPRPGYDDSYKIVGSLGQGGFGKVSLVWKNGQYYAMKKLDLSKVADVVGAALNNDEIQSLSSLNHHNVVAYVDSFYEIAGAYRGIYIVMEYCQRGSLRNLMQTEGPTGRLSNPLYIINLTMQICRGLAYIHSTELIHRDIKPENIFIANSGNVKIGDFGCCKVLAYNQMATTYVGTPRYIAPEVGQCQYSYASDMYSAGVVFSELWSRVPVQLGRQYPAMDLLIERLKNTYSRLRPTADETLRELSVMEATITNPNQFVPPQIPAVIANPNQLVPPQIPAAIANPNQFVPPQIPAAIANPNQFVPPQIPAAIANPNQFVPPQIPAAIANPNQFVPPQIPATTASGNFAVP